MRACKAVRKWITEKVQKPFEKWVEEAKEKCTEAKKWVEKTIREPIEKRRTKTEKKCKKRKCKWWCACCNKWFCWLETILEIIVEWIVKVVGEWLVEIVCKIVLQLVKIIVQVVVSVLKFVIVGFTCLFTYPRGALDALIDFWFDLVDILADIGNLFKIILDGLVDLIDLTKESILDLADRFGAVGRFIGGLIAGFLDIIRRIADGIGQMIEGFYDILTGLLSLDFCKVLNGLVDGIGFGLGQVIFGATGVLTLGGNGARDAIVRNQLRDWLQEQLEERFREEDLEEMEDKLRMGSTEFGMDWNVLPLRATISSRSQHFDLAAMHRAEEINLYKIAGYAPIGCKNVLSGSKFILVYKDTNLRVDYADIRDYLDGDQEVPEFVLMAGEYHVMRDMVVVAERKFKQMGIHLQWSQFDTVELQRDEFFMNSPKLNNFANRVTSEFGLQDVCDLPAVMVFDYDPSNFGLANPWWLGEQRQTTLASVRSNFLARLFGTLLAHEMGHCFALCHAGHDGMEHIMYTAATNGNNCGNTDPSHSHDLEQRDLKTVTGKTLLEYILLGGEPRFTLQDGKDAWTWILNQANECI